MENTTDPFGFPERVLLTVGDVVFKKRVMFLDPIGCRYSCVPAIDLNTLTSILSGTSESFYLHLSRDSALSRYTRDRILANAEYFEIRRPNSSSNEDLFTSYFVSRVNLEEPVEILPISSVKLGRAGVEHGLTHPEEAIDKFLYNEKPGVSLRCIPDIQPIETNQRSGEYFHGLFKQEHDRNQFLTISAIVDDELRVTISGREVIFSPGPKGKTPIATTVDLAPGVHEIEIYYTNLNGTGSLDFSLAWASGEKPRLYCSTFGE